MVHGYTQILSWVWLSHEQLCTETARHSLKSVLKQLEYCIWWRFKYKRNISRFFKLQTETFIKLLIFMPDKSIWYQIKIWTPCKVFHDQETRKGHGMMPNFANLMTLVGHSFFTKMTTLYLKRPHLIIDLCNCKVHSDQAFSFVCMSWLTLEHAMIAKVLLCINPCWNAIKVNNFSSI